MFLEYPNNEYKPRYTTAYKSEIETTYDPQRDYIASMTASNTEDHNEFDEMMDNVDRRRQRVCVTTPQPAILFPTPQWTGKQLFSMCLPDKINLTTGKRQEEDLVKDTSVSILNG